MDSNGVKLNELWPWPWVQGKCYTGHFLASRDTSMQRNMVRTILSGQGMLFDLELWPWPCCRIINVKYDTSSHEDTQVCNGTLLSIQRVEIKILSGQGMPLNLNCGLVYLWRGNGWSCLPVHRMRPKCTKILLWFMTLYSGRFGKGFRVTDQ